MIKKLYIYWAQGFDKLAGTSGQIIKKCIQSWQSYNPDWEIIKLDDNTVPNYVDIPKAIKDLKKKKMDKTAYSDILRIFLLEKHGGCWCDSTLFCTKPLHTWLPAKSKNTGFFGFGKKKENEIASWFLYSDKNNYIISKWRQSVINYWAHRDINEEYFWFHGLFKDLCINDKKFKQLWEQTSRILACGPHLLLKNGLFNAPSREMMNHMQNIVSPVYKLTRKSPRKKRLLKRSSATQLFNMHSNIWKKQSDLKKLRTVPTPKPRPKPKPKPDAKQLKLIHIGKCGGTFVEQIFNLKSYHHNRNYKLGHEQYIIWVRHPLKRFISAFWFSYDLVHLDISSFNKDNLTIENSMAPQRVKYKMTHDHTFSKNYDSLIIYFKSPTELAEALTSKKSQEREKAVELMNSTEEHITKGIGWYLNNGDFVHRHHQRIYFVGALENMDQDCELLAKKMGTTYTKKEGIRTNHIKHDKTLSELAVKNLLEFYKNTDYKALKALQSRGYLSDELYESYQQF